ncbi:DUF4870 domain-containing protein [Thalassoglobus polymorphus]|uniref:SHOCT domain-containing protein n=1 Tax=Thalassoglobus polymorphus TaxID=2527994 RepID=A0A517QMG2_9PLAN|nr:DUF4870 domain-containing protein [Thalassoglobus polymorphus]QDT32791.1 hypothetical protein Mal48_20380 [Thalassoglobus polymorphus]
MSISDEIEKLERLRNQGTLSEAEFQEAKARVIQSDSQQAVSMSSEDIFGMKPNTWCMLMHLSQLLYGVAGIGFITPIVMWLMTKDQNAEADRQGAAIVNWLLTSFLALVVTGILSVFLIGIPFLIIYIVLVHVFPIVGAIKAANGEYWEYPTSIRFVRFDENHRDSYGQDSY